MKKQQFGEGGLGTAVLLPTGTAMGEHVSWSGLAKPPEAFGLTCIPGGLQGTWLLGLGAVTQPWLLPQSRC